MDHFFQAEGNLFFGSQPSAGDLEELKRKGMGTIVNLRHPGEETELSPEEEQKRAESLGMRYVNIPVTAGDVDDELMRKIHETLQEARADGSVFVH